MVPRQHYRQRHTKTTILIVGEGPTEKAFLTHIKNLYVTKEMNVAVKIECGSGGSPQNVIEKAIRLKPFYNKCFVLIDSDVSFEPDNELKRRMKKKPSIRLLYSTPCIECLFISILDQKFSQNSANSHRCKQIFHTKYLAESNKTNPSSYSKSFTKEIIEQRRTKIPELNSILTAMK